jgi:serine/threonine protein phosphatase PrpC
VKRLSPDDKALVIGSDGLWEHLNPKLLISKLMPSLALKDPEQGSQLLIRYSLDKWQEVGLLLHRILIQGTT